MSDVGNIFEKRVMPMLEAQKKAKEQGKHEYECPLCKGTAKWARAEGNRHLWIKCMDCDFVLVE